MDVLWMLHSRCSSPYWSLIDLIDPFALERWKGYRPYMAIPSPSNLSNSWQIWPGSMLQYVVQVPWSKHAIWDMVLQEILINPCSGYLNPQKNGLMTIIWPSNIQLWPWHICSLYAGASRYDSQPALPSMLWEATWSYQGYHWGWDCDTLSNLDQPT